MGIYPLAVAGEGSGDDQDDINLRQLFISLQKTGDPIVFEGRPENPYDDQAIAVIGTGFRLGWVPRKEQWFRDIFWAGREVDACVLRVMERYGTYGLTLLVGTDGDRAIDAIDHFSDGLTE